MKKPILSIYLGLVAFSLAGSLLSKLTGLAPGPIAPAASILTLLAGVAAIFLPAAKEIGWIKVLCAAGIVLVGGFVVEWIGVHTGKPFGRYEYTSAWWPTFSLPTGERFPFMLPVAWLLVAGASYLVVGGFLSRFHESPVGNMAGGGLLAAVIDLVMEPVMTGPLGYWRWLEAGPLPGGVPFDNFLGWWLTAAAAGLVFGAFGFDSVAAKSDAKWVLAAHLVLTVGIGMIGLPSR